MSSQLTQRDSLDTESELLPQEPPPWSLAGQALPPRLGVKGDANIIVGGRTLIEYAFESIRQLRESIKQ